METPVYMLGSRVSGSNSAQKGTQKNQLSPESALGIKLPEMKVKCFCLGWKKKMPKNNETTNQLTEPTSGAERYCCLALCDCPEEAVPTAF
jgi:hypothetical protein